MECQCDPVFCCRCRCWSIEMWTPCWGEPRVMMAYVSNEQNLKWLGQPYSRGRLLPVTLAGSESSGLPEWDPFFWGVKLDEKMYSSFKGISLSSATCLGWCHVNDPCPKSLSEGGFPNAACTEPFLEVCFFWWSNMYHSTMYLTCLIW